MFEFSQLALCGVHGGIPIPAVLTLVNTSFLKINQFLRVTEHIGCRLINRHRESITQTLLAFAPVHGTTTDALRQLLMRHD